MKTFIATILLSSCSLLAWAQEEASYYLPRTALRFTITVEKSSYTPGDFCQFSERYLKKRAESLPSELHRILNVEVKNFGTSVTPITDIIYERYAAMKPTIITTNLDTRQIRTEYNERVADRLNEICRVIGYKNESYRK